MRRTAGLQQRLLCFSTWVCGLSLWRFSSCHMPVTRSISKSVRVSKKAVEPAAELNNVSPNHNPQGVKPVVRTRASGTLFCWVIYYYYSSSNNNNNNNNNNNSNNNNNYYYYNINTPSVCVIIILRTIIRIISITITIILIITITTIMMIIKTNTNYYY
jgi:hypothetical protein